MVYLLDVTKREWVRVHAPSHELVKKQIQGVALQQDDMPAEVRVEGAFDLPDICRPTHGLLFVSDRGRAALEELAPGCVAFFPLSVRVPERMHPAEAYFYIDVLRRGHCIDWDRSETTRRVVAAPGGGESRAVKGVVWNPSTKFKAVDPDAPDIWREADVDRPTVHFFHSKVDVFMRDGLWNEMNDRFPGQLFPRKLL
ncbi:MAG: hypothetical protein JO141_00465 [Bradyrhizobium sp.]|nr:hypothetical protein [Bradyrhizobium sp.]